jgi:hypothetical protein
MTYGYTKFPAPSPNGLLHAATKPNHRFQMSATLCFYTLFGGGGGGGLKKFKSFPPQKKAKLKK